MWIKPGMLQYVDFALIFSSPKHDVFMVSYCGRWLFVIRRRVSSVVNVLSVDTLENPIALKNWSKCLSRQYLGQGRICLLTCRNLGHQGVMLD